MSPRWKEASLLAVAAAVPFLGWVSMDLAREGRVVASGALYPLLLAGMFLLAHLALRFFRPAADPVLFPLAAALSSLGVVILLRLNPHMARLQVIWLGIGLAGMAVLAAALKDHRVLERYRYTLAVIGLALLLSTVFIGREVNGARLWLVFGPLRFQPSELAKVLLAVFFAAYLAERRELIVGAGRRFLGVNLPRPRDLGPLLTMWALSLLLLIFQRDLGSSLLFFGIFLAVLYAATSRASFVVVGLLLFLAGAVATSFAFSHVRARVDSWLDPLNPETVNDESYQIAQSLFAFAEGGLSGTGLARGRPDIIPFVETDFAFAAVGEELGLLGAAAVVILFLLFAGRGLSLALRCEDDFGKLLAVGLTTIVFLQAFIIMGGDTRLVPLTGITLPFVSYGGSSLVSNFLILGLLLCISGAPREAGKRTGGEGRSARRERGAGAGPSGAGTGTVDVGGEGVAG
ncbi:MAG: FtsW/RodA/SpoVE family cell cycle protein [Actinobacteria bacterium]|nr:FtsW/RodA/SpoVE family cell cycle protein [Actinomycetota bacterium]